MKINQLYLISIIVFSLTSNVNAFDQSSPPNSLIVDENGNVGIGTHAPAKGLHISRDDGKGAIRITESVANTQKRFLLQLENNGAPGMNFTDTSSGNGWQFAQTNSGGFTVSRLGAGGQDFFISDAGRVRMGPGSTTNFDLQTGGDLIIPNGSVTANGVLLTSSRTMKTEITPVDSKEVLSKIKNIEVSEWRYKKAHKNDRHISPMAEDFYSLFKLGPDDKYINPNDLASVAIIAAKELSSQTDILQEENKLLKERLTALEKILTNIASVKNINSLNNKMDLAINKELE